MVKTQIYHGQASKYVDICLFVTRVCLPIKLYLSKKHLICY